MSSGSGSNPVDLQTIILGSMGQYQALAMARQNDGTQFDDRVLDGAIASTLLASNDAALNTAARIPTTLSSGDSTGATQK